MRTALLVWSWIFFLILPHVFALGNLEIQFIPKNISVNSSFLLIVNADYLESESIRISWNVPGIYPPQYGLVPKMKDKWVCYFSNTDPQSTCGPVPFTLPSTPEYPYQMIIEAFNQKGENVTKTLDINVGGIVLTPKIIVREKNVYVSVWASGPVEGILYKLYDSNFLPVDSGELVLQPESMAYLGNFSLSPGEYYIAFQTLGENNFGGAVVRFTVGISKEISSNILVDSIEFSAVIDKGQEYKVTKFRIKNTGDSNVSDLWIDVPEGLRNYLNVDLEKSVLDPGEISYLTVTLQNIQSSMEIKTDLELKSGSTLLTKIPTDIKITVMGYQDPTSCEGKEDGEYCLGGICCSEICRIKAECCSDSDCESNEECKDYRCVSLQQPQPQPCPEGTCYPGDNESACPEGMVYTYYHCTTSGGESGVCCKRENINECEGKSDGEICSNGICCSGVCIEGGECCTNSDCLSSEEVCINHQCQTPSFTEPTASQEGNGSIVVIVILLIILAIGGWFVYNKFLRERRREEEEEEYTDEDFY